MDNEIIIKQSQLKQFLIMLLAIIMVAVSIFVFCSDINLFGVNFLNKIIGGFVTIFFGACLLFIIIRFFKPKDILVIDKNGITDNSSAISIGFIPWKDVKSSYITTVSTQTFIAIELNNFEEKLKELSFLKRIMLKINLKMGYAPVSIVLNSTKHKPKEVLEIIQKYKEIYDNDNM
ncbi:MAG: hypothetical protein GX270_03565 [Clostridiaceae bacterium]|jgi:K+ transporter|nr:hypothetical protein [Clostridiaceae bacterium]